MEPAQYGLDSRTLATRDEFKLEFSGSSEPELWRFQAEPSWGTLFSSWNRADNSDNMYVNKKQILVPTPKLQSNFLIFMNICKTIDIFGVEYYDL